VSEAHSFASPRNRSVRGSFKPPRAPRVRSGFAQRLIHHRNNQRKHNVLDLLLLREKGGIRTEHRRSPRSGGASGGRANEVAVSAKRETRPTRVTESLPLRKTRSTKHSFVRLCFARERRKLWESFREGFEALVSCFGREANQKCHKGY
jgi:hypothetical protein